MKYDSISRLLLPGLDTIIFQIHCMILSLPYMETYITSIAHIHSSIYLPIYNLLSTFWYWKYVVLVTPAWPGVWHNEPNKNIFCFLLSRLKYVWRFILTFLKETGGIMPHTRKMCRLSSYLSLFHLALSTNTRGKKWWISNCTIVGLISDIWKTDQRNSETW